MLHKGGNSGTWLHGLSCGRGHQRYHTLKAGGLQRHRRCQASVDGSWSMNCHTSVKNLDLPGMEAVCMQPSQTMTTCNNCVCTHLSSPAMVVQTCLLESELRVILTAVQDLQHACLYQSGRVTLHVQKLP